MNWTRFDHSDPRASSALSWLAHWPWYRRWTLLAYLKLKGVDLSAYRQERSRIASA
ncbi:MAG TPA: hypothetical protein VFB23_12475 [Candidatus Acidoferrales bacterium]|jgi:hypothetical protein|nr:hypothetical protein [Candidatus Acidoferrales bacterium]